MVNRLKAAVLFALGGFLYAHVPTTLLSADGHVSRAVALSPYVAALAAFVLAMPVRKMTSFAGALVAFWAFIVVLVYLAATPEPDSKLGGGVVLRFAILFAGGAPTFGWPACLLGAMIGPVCDRLWHTQPNLRMERAGMEGSAL